MGAGDDTSPQCGSVVLPYAINKCKSVAWRTYSVFLCSSNNNDNIKMVLVTFNHATTSGSVGSGSDSVNSWQSNSFVSDDMCRPRCGFSIFYEHFVGPKSGGRPVVTCPHINVASSCCRNRCSKGFVCGKSRREYQLVLHISEVIFFSVFFCLLAGACSASCQTEASGTNCSLHNSDAANLASQAPTDHNLSNGSPYVNPLNKGDSNSTSNRHNHSSHIPNSAPENPVLQPDERLETLLASSQHLAKATAGRPAYSSATSLPLTGLEKDEDFNKIISMVVPFVCVIILAIILCVSWMLCRKYKCCHNKACLQKCSAFCDNCMSAPYVFQVPGNVKVQSQLSRDSTGLTLVSHRPHSSQAHRPTGGIAHKPLRKPNMSHRDLSSASVSRQSSSRSSRLSTGYSPVGRQSSLHAHSMRQSSGQAKDIPQTSVQSSSGQQTS